MENIIGSLSNIQLYIIIGLIIINIILVICIVVVFRSLSVVEKRYRKFMRGSNNKSLEELIISYLEKAEESKEVSENIKTLYSNIEKQLRLCIQKISVVRYKAFENVGSDLSFSLALLDSNDNGVILTSIYCRNESTVYAKPIDKGISRYDLTEEEKSVLSDAMHKGENDQNTKIN